MQNILVLIVKAEHAGAILMQCFEDVKMSISCSKVEGSASLNTLHILGGSSFDQEKSHLHVFSINTSRRPLA